MLGIDDLVFVDGVKDYLDDRKKVVENHEDVFLFGSARGGERVYEYLSGFGLEKKIKYVIDNDPMKQGKLFHGILIIGADELCSIFSGCSEAVIIIASGSAHIIKKQLIEKGIPDKCLEPFVITNLQLDPTPFQYFKKHTDQIEKVYQLLADNRSRDIFISLINFKMTQEKKWLNGISDDEHEQYFDDVIHMDNRECFVDCGAYIGDTLDEYSERFNGEWEKYYCFEADEDIFKELNKHVAACKYVNVETINVGCWDKKETLNFEQQGSGSSSIVDNENGITINADSIDSILSDKKITVIKMDIEGAEQKALKGAEMIIKSQHPKLAISIYHSLEDFLFIPEMLKDYDDKYNIYIRHYRELTDSETVCYAV